MEQQQPIYTVFDGDAPRFSAPTLTTQDVQFARLEASTLRLACIRIYRPERGFTVDFELWRDAKRWNGNAWEAVQP